MRLEGKVAPVTGGARGMGAAAARIFGREGAKALIADVLEDEGRRTEALINETGGDAVFVRLDVTRQADWDAAISVAGERREERGVRNECRAQFILSLVEVGGGRRFSHSFLTSLSSLLPLARSIENDIRPR